MVHGAQQREQHLPQALLPGRRAHAAALAGDDREQRPRRAVAHLRPHIHAQPLQPRLCPHGDLLVLLSIDQSICWATRAKLQLAHVSTCTHA